MKTNFTKLCIGDPYDHGINGLGNQLYAISNNAILARRYNLDLAIGSPLVRATFDISNTFPKNCVGGTEFPLNRAPRCDQTSKKCYRSLKHNVTTRWWYWESSVNQPLRPTAMHFLFASRYQPWVWNEVRRIQATVPKIYTVIHIRTFSDLYCAKKPKLGSCGQCLPTRTLHCIHNAIRGGPALLFTDYDGEEMRTLLRKSSKFGKPDNTVYRIESEMFHAGIDRHNWSLSIHKKRSIASVLWALAYEAPFFIGTSSSTLSKSIAMARLKHKRSMLVDMRCRYGKEDHEPFPCRKATLANLV